MQKSPRKTPSKSPFKVRKNTPNSSAKKKLALKFRPISGEFEDPTSSSSSEQSFLSLRRVLFVSPETKRSSSAGGLLEKKSTKRALFASPVNSSHQKRNRDDFGENNSSKFTKSMSLDIQPSRLEYVLNRTFRETIIRPSTSRSGELSEQHKKKLQWAVYESLRLQNVTSAHPQFKVFASVLARVTRRFWQNLKDGGTTERMFRIARHHSYAVVKGKTVDEIINEYVKNKLKHQKPQGYVGVPDLNLLKHPTSDCGDKENIYVDKANIIESISKRREHAGTSKTKLVSERRIDRIKKVISFEEKFSKDV